MKESTVTIEIEVPESMMCNAYRIAAKRGCDWRIMLSLLLALAVLELDREMTREECVSDENDRAGVRP